MTQEHPGLMAVEDEALGNTAYVVDVGDGAAVVVDPRRDVSEYLECAGRLGCQIVAVLETHLHADFVGGAKELGRRAGATVYAAGAADLLFDHVRVAPGETITIGAAQFDVIATPGHTPEHLAYLARLPEGLRLFSGGSLITGGAGRTDLTGDARTDELARAQFASVRRLGAYPDDTLLCPTHGAGSFCSAGPADSGFQTLGEQRENNPLLRIEEEGDFVARLRAGSGTHPSYFTHLREVNRAGAPLVAELAPIPELPAHEAAAAAAAGAWVIDGRPVQRWARAHPRNSVSIQVRAAFASWLGWVVPFGEPMVLVLDRSQVDEAVRLARRIGYDRILGWLEFDPWKAAALPVSSVKTVTAAQAADRGDLLLDVRQLQEFEAEHVAGATHIELGDLIAGVLPDAAAVTTYCGHGERSATAASLLARRGVQAVNLRGGIDAWRRAGLPLER
jgi:glyoxylase-like metal-dependent hydrolase (beta-lactamase superfamily II)/rhodanese-related sulfurtransferase